MSLLDVKQVNQGYLPNDVGNHLQLSRLRETRANEIAQSSKPNHAVVMIFGNLFVPLCNLE